MDEKARHREDGRNASKVISVSPKSALTFCEGSKPEMKRCVPVLLTI
jgi:hypothetical protein